MVYELLSPEVARITRREFPEFTEVQKQAIPVICKGQNALVIAPTGSGKTETALLPVLSSIERHITQRKAKNEAPKGIQAIYITPLRALNRDILLRMEKICAELGISVAVRHGDTTATERVKQRDNPPLFLITTPETLQSILIAPLLSDALVNVKHVIIDEVHELYESKRGVQLGLALERLNEKSPRFQRIGLSATIGAPEEVAKFIGKETVICDTQQKRKLELIIEYINRAKGSEAAKLKAQLHMPSSTIARMQRIEELIHEHKSALVFVNTRYAAESISNGLYAIESLKEKVSVHHSSLSKEVRLEAEKRFKAQEVKAIVCTSSLELGIDIGTVEVVAQYGSPRHVTRLLQRIGRSGHRHYLHPKGVILPTDEIELAESIALCQAAQEKQLEKPEHFHNALDVLGHFITGIATEYHTIQTKRVYELAKRSYSYANLTEAEFKRTLLQMRNNGLVNIIEQNGEEMLQTKGTRTKLYYYENISTIPDQNKFFVRDSATRKNVAVLDESFVSEFIEVNGIFVAQGKAWKVLSISEKEVVVEATGDVTAAIPDWLGEEIPVTLQTSQKVASLISGEAPNKQHVHLGNREETALAEFSASQNAYFAPSRDIVVEENIAENLIVMHSFYGLRANETIARTLSFLLGQRDKSLKTRASPYSIVLEFSRPVGGKEIIEVLKKLNENTIKTVLTSALPSTRLFRHKFTHVAKRFGFLSKKWDASGASMSRIIAALPIENPMVKETLSELFHSRLSLQEAMNAAKDISTQEIQVKLIYSKQWSPLAKSALEMGGMTELVIPAEPTEAILEAFANTLKEKITVLYCTFCKNNFTILLNQVNLSDEVKCPHCKSNQVTLPKYLEKENRAEKDKVASLISSYGAKSLFALETYGIGPQTASRMLARMHKTESEFYQDLLETQKTFIKNRKFWKI